MEQEFSACMFNEEHGVLYVSGRKWNYAWRQHQPPGRVGTCIAGMSEDYWYQVRERTTQYHDFEIPMDYKDTMAHQMETSPGWALANEFMDRDDVSLSTLPTPFPPDAARMERE